MSLDVSTLTFVGGLITLSSGLFMIGYWFYDRTARSALWWAASNCGGGIGIILLSLVAVLPVVIPSVVAPLILNLGAVLTFVASRSFNRQSVAPLRVIPGVVIWFAAAAVAANTLGERYAEGLGVGVSAALGVAAAHAFWLARAERLRARTAMIIFLSGHAVGLFVFATEFVLADDHAIVPSIHVLGVLDFMGLVYPVGVTMLLVLMYNQGREEKYKADASVDSLTGLFNRRGVLNRAQRMLDRARLNGEAFAVIAFDLDRFKAINDNFGHAFGDKVLVIFADVLLSSLRPADIAGRLGGEEFVALVVAQDHDAPISAANRVRENFQAAAECVDGQYIGATVSAGVAIAAANEPDGFAALLASADTALYCAKRTGRNRVIPDGNDAPAAGSAEAGLIA